LTMIAQAHFYRGALDDVLRYADELEHLGSREHNLEAAAFALALRARVKLIRGDLANARSLFADSAAVARARTAGWPRSIALCGLASATLATGDEVGARAILEEALLFCGGVGYVGIDSLCGALALLALRAGERGRARRIFGVVAAGTEDRADYSATLTDPSGALREATREARSLLGDPSPGDPSVVDLDAVLEAVLGTHAKRVRR